MRVVYKVSDSLKLSKKTVLFISHLLGSVCHTAAPMATVDIYAVLTPVSIDRVDDSGSRGISS